MLDNHDIENFKVLLQDIGASINTLDIPQPDYRTQAAIAAMQSLLSSDREWLEDMARRTGQPLSSVVIQLSIVFANDLMAELEK